MEECRELLTSVAAGLEDLKNLRRRLEVLSSDIEEVRGKQKYRSSFFITPTPLRSGVDHGDTGYRSVEGVMKRCSISIFVV